MRHKLNDIHRRGPPRLQMCFVSELAYGPVPLAPKLLVWLMDNVFAFLSEGVVGMWESLVDWCGC